MKRSPVFLMANLGSEISQIFMYLEKGDKSMAESAFVRSQPIFQELLSHNDLKGRTKEVEVLKDLVEDTILEKKNFIVNRRQIEEYFLPFSLLVMNN